MYVAINVVSWQNIVGPATILFARKIEMPESLVRRQTNRELQRLTLELQRNGFNQEQIKSYVNASRFNARESTVAALREHFVLEKIAEVGKFDETSGTGIAFQVDVEDAIGVRHQIDVLTETVEERI